MCWLVTFGIGAVYPTTPLLLCEAQAGIFDLGCCAGVVEQHALCSMGVSQGTGKDSSKLHARLLYSDHVQRAERSDTHSRVAIGHPPLHDVLSEWSPVYCGD